jgi:hypothetical protein
VHLWYKYKHSVKEIDFYDNFEQSVCIYCINLSAKFTFLPVPKPYTNKFCVRRQCTGIYLSYHFVIIHIDKVTFIAVVAEIVRSLLCASLV